MQTALAYQLVAATWTTTAIFSSDTRKYAYGVARQLKPLTKQYHAELLKMMKTYTYLEPCPGEDSAYVRGGDALRKFWIKLLKETNLGVAQPSFDPKRDHFKLSLHESSK